MSAGQFTGLWWVRVQGGVSIDFEAVDAVYGAVQACNDWCALPAASSVCCGLPADIHAAGRVDRMITIFFDCDHPSSPLLPSPSGDSALDWPAGCLERRCKCVWARNRGSGLSTSLLAGLCVMRFRVWGRPPGWPLRHEV